MNIMLKKQQSQQQRGFTIVELLIVIVVIAILAAISIVAYNGIQQRVRDADRVNDVAAIKKALELYYIDKGSYPNSRQMSTAIFRRDELNLPEDKARPLNSTSVSPSYCYPGKTYSYCYIGFEREGGQTGDCTGGTVGFEDEKCKKFGLFYALEKDPATSIYVGSSN